MSVRKTEHGPLEEWPFLLTSEPSLQSWGLGILNAHLVFWVSVCFFLFQFLETGSVYVVLAILELAM